MKAVELVRKKAKYQAMKEIVPMDSKGVYQAKVDRIDNVLKDVKDKSEQK